jgi:hypothetical protein
VRVCRIPAPGYQPSGRHFASDRTETDDVRELDAGAQDELAAARAYDAAVLRHRGPAARTNFVIPPQPAAGPDAGLHVAGCAAPCPTPADPLAADPAGGCPAPAAARELAALQKPSRRSARADAPRAARWGPGTEGGDRGEGEWGAGARRGAPARESGYMGVSWRGPRQRWVAELWDGQAYELLGARRRTRSTYTVTVTAAVDCIVGRLIWAGFVVACHVPWWPCSIHACCSD